MAVSDGWFVRRAGLMAAAFIVASGLPHLAMSQDSSQRQIEFATMDLEPYGFAEADEERRGIFSEIADAIAARSGLSIRNRVMPIKRMLKQVELGVSDCGIFLLQGSFSESYDQVALVMEEMRAILISGQGVELDEIEDLRRYRLGWVNGTFGGTFVADDPDIERLITKSYRNSAELLLSGRVDVIAGTELSLLYNLGQIGAVREDIGSILTFLSSPIWLHCTQQGLSADLQARLRDAVVEIREDGTLDRIVDGYRVPELTAAEGRD